MKKKRTIGFYNFWEGFNTAETFSKYIVPFLEPYYEFVYDDFPDFLIYSNTALRMAPPIRDQITDDVTTIFFDGEYLPHINMRSMDWAFTCLHIDNERHWRLPYYMTRMLYTGTDPKELIKPDNYNPRKIREEKTAFCNFLFSNPATVREHFFDLMEQYKRVMAAGKSKNNIGEQLPGIGFTGGKYHDKLDFLSKFKFTIAFENDRGYDTGGNGGGYTTEKLTEPMLSNSIPIYWGNPYVDRDFNTDSFISFTDHCNRLRDGEIHSVRFEQMVEKVAEIDKDDSLYEHMLEQPWLKNNELTEYLRTDLLVEQFKKVFD